MGLNGLPCLAVPGDISKLKEMFTDAQEGVSTHMQGNIDLLIGLDNHRLHPMEGRDWQLQASRIFFAVEPY